jgi:1-acyl-sn-glycerol-3-phosphate acyltransferase
MVRLYTLFANIVSFFILWPMTLLYTILVLISAQLHFKSGVKLFLWLWANSIFAGLLRKVHVKGKEHIAPEKNYLLVMNHTSMFDFPAIMAVFPRVAWLGRDNLIKIPVFGQMLLSIDYIPIYPGETERSKQSIETAIARSSRIHIAIFPEGTRTLDGTIQDFKKGFTYIVRDTDLDILPVTINGLFFWKQKYQKYITPLNRVTLVIQKPISNSFLREMSNEEMASYMKTVVENGLMEDFNG